MLRVASDHYWVWLWARRGCEGLHTTRRGPTVAGSQLLDASTCTVPLVHYYDDQLLHAGLRLTSSAAVRFPARQKLQPVHMHVGTGG
jgi:hypothetical protein